MRIAIIVGHPQSATYCEAIARAYQRGARAAGHQVTLSLLGEIMFDPILHHGYQSGQPLEDGLAAVRACVMAADHLVFIFPLWMGSMPALLKGFFERVFQPDLIGPARTGKFPKLLARKSARIIVTMAMPTIVYRWWFGAYEVRMLRRNILRFLGIGRVRCTLLGRVPSVSRDQRERWLDDMLALGAKGR